MKLQDVLSRFNYGKNIEGKSFDYLSFLKNTNTQLNSTTFGLLKKSTISLEENKEVSFGTKSELLLKKIGLIDGNIKNKSKVNENTEEFISEIESCLKAENYVDAVYLGYILEPEIFSKKNIHIDESEIKENINKRQLIIKNFDLLVEDIKLIQKTDKKEYFKELSFLIEKSNKRQYFIEDLYKKEINLKE